MFISTYAQCSFPHMLVDGDNDVCKTMVCIYVYGMIILVKRLTDAIFKQMLLSNVYVCNVCNMCT